jgi:hypothetical protein
LPVTRLTSSHPPRPQRQRSSEVFLRQGIIYAQDALHYESAVGRVVRRTGGEFFGLAIYQQRADFQLDRRVFIFSDHPLDRRLLAESDRVLLRSGHAYLDEQNQAHQQIRKLFSCFQDKHRRHWENTGSAGCP